MARSSASIVLLITICACTKVDRTQSTSSYSSAVTQGKARQFQPFTVEDLTPRQVITNPKGAKTRKSIPYREDDLLSLARIKGPSVLVPARQYLDDVNRLEIALNQEGRSLRDRDISKHLIKNLEDATRQVAVLATKLGDAQTNTIDQLNWDSGWQGIGVAGAKVQLGGTLSDKTMLVSDVYALSRAQLFGFEFDVLKIDLSNNIPKPSSFSRQSEVMTSKLSIAVLGEDFPLEESTEISHEITIKDKNILAGEYTILTFGALAVKLKGKLYLHGSITASASTRKDSGDLRLTLNLAAKADLATLASVIILDAGIHLDSELLGLHPSIGIKTAITPPPDVRAMWVRDAQIDISIGAVSFGGEICLDLAQLNIPGLGRYCKRILTISWSGYNTNIPLASKVLTSSRLCNYICDGTQCMVDSGCNTRCECSRPADCIQDGNKKKYICRASESPLEKYCVAGRLDCRRRCNRKDRAGCFDQCEDDFQYCLKPGSTDNGDGGKPHKPIEPPKKPPCLVQPCHSEK